MKVIMKATKPLVHFKHVACNTTIFVIPHYQYSYYRGEIQDNQRHVNTEADVRNSVALEFLCRTAQPLKDGNSQ